MAYTERLIHEITTCVLRNTATACPAISKYRDTSNQQATLRRWLVYCAIDTGIRRSSCLRNCQVLNTILRAFTLDNNSSLSSSRIGSDRSLYASRVSLRFELIHSSVERQFWRVEHWSTFVLLLRSVLHCPSCS
jgi:hypothetical protein